MTVLDIKKLHNTIKRWIFTDIFTGCRDAVPLTPGDGATQIFVCNLNVKESDISDELISNIRRFIWRVLIKDRFVVSRYEHEIEVDKREDDTDAIQIRVKMKCGKCYRRSNKPIPKGGMNYVSNWKK